MALALMVVEGWQYRPLLGPPEASRRRKCVIRHDFDGGENKMAYGGL